MMSIYATLVKFTAQEITAMANTQKALKEATRMATEMRIKLIGSYAILGPYDVMFIYEVPDEKAAAGMAMGFAAKWGGHPETWTLIPAEDLPSIATKRRGQNLK
jgi:uncharacterized protein with GYD domain